MRGNILVVDDEAGPRESLRMILKQSHDVRTADGGVAALEQIAREKPDLVFMDLRMPGMQGTELMQAVKERYPDVEVAIITAYAAVESARLAVRCGAVDYLTKPYSVADVTRIVDKALATRRQQHDAAVLTAQLARMTEALAGQVRSLDSDASPDVVNAVDELRSAQTALSEDLESMRQLSQLGEVTAEVTHDINNLLTVILTNSQFLALELSGPEGVGANAGARATRIARAAEDCAGLLKRIKDFVRLSVEFRAAPVDVNALVAMVVDLKREAPTATGARAEWAVRTSTVPLVQGDELSLRTALTNLVQNSLEALDRPGLIEVSTEAEDGCVRLRVRDTGRGMSPEVLERSQETFYTAGKAQGTGLGLSTVRQVAKRHGGQLDIDSVEGRGTTITLTLPVRPVAAEEAPVEPCPACAAAPAPPSAEVPPADPGQTTVVLVEDEEGIREIMATVLELDGYRVLQAGDGNTGWSLFEGAREAATAGRLVVVTDHEVPGMLGRDLAARVKAESRDVPVMIVSGYLDLSTQGAEDYLLGKPFDVDEFLALVRRLAERAAARV
jgi:two-component system, cell cycle sensor histidine kinase and response regulator CckA